MHSGQRLAARIERTITGPMWHGPALAEVLTGVDHRAAAARPIAGAHSIWELVVHTAVWAEIARERVAGRALGDPPPEDDWPRAPGGEATADAWAAAQARLSAAYQALAATAATLDDDALRAIVRGKEYSVGTMLRGVVEHGTYHGGQVALLKRARAAHGA
jgi:uncharacterized damage-inducible protein DinB